MAASQKSFGHTESSDRIVEELLRHLKRFLGGSHLDTRRVLGSDILDNSPPYYGRVIFSLSVGVNIFFCVTI